MNLALDLYCGLGGWAEGFIAEGWRVVGVDKADFSKQYPGEFICADVLTWRGWMTLRPRVVLASAPCEEYSRHAMPWTRAKNPPQPNLKLWHCAEFIAAMLEVPLVLENVRAAQAWHGPSKMNCGPFHLWGDVPAIVPVFSGRKKESYGSHQRAERAKVPLHLARWIARTYGKN